MTALTITHPHRLFLLFTALAITNAAWVIAALTHHRPITITTHGPSTTALALATTVLWTIAAIRLYHTR